MIIEELSFLSAHKLISKFDGYVEALSITHKTETFMVALMRSERWQVRNTKNGVIITHVKSNKSVYLSNEDYAVIIM